MTRQSQLRDCTECHCLFAYIDSVFCDEHRCKRTSPNARTGDSIRCCHGLNQHPRKHTFWTADRSRHWETPCWGRDVSDKEMLHDALSSQRRTSVASAVANSSMSTPHASSQSTQRTSRVITSRPSEPTACRVDGCILQASQGSEYCSRRHRCTHSYMDWDLTIKYRCVNFHISHRSSQCTYAIYSDSAERAAGNASTRKSSVVFSDAAATVTGRRGVQTKNPTPRRLEKRERCGRSFCTTRCAPASSFCEEHDARCSAHFCRLPKTAGSDFCDKHRCPTFAKRSGSNLAARCEHRAGWRGRPCSECLHR